MQIIAISTDDVEDSQRLARRYALWFPLVADADQSMSKAYAGVDSNGYSNPGLFVVRRNGTIAFRMLGERGQGAYANELLEIIDDELGLQNAP